MTDYWEDTISATNTAQLGDEAMAELRKIRLPAILLNELRDDAVPGYLYPLVMVVRMLGNLPVYDDAASNRARALRVIERARKELRDAERRCRE